MYKMLIRPHNHLRTKGRNRNQRIASLIYLIIQVILTGHPNRALQTKRETGKEASSKILKAAMNSKTLK